MDKEDWQKKGQGHRRRLREKYLELGIEAFTDAEVLELILTMGTPRRDCKEPARAALSRFGTLAEVLEASSSDLLAIKGLGATNTFAIGFIHAVARRYLSRRVREKKYLCSSSEVIDYLTHAMRDLNHEIFKVIFLDAGHAIVTEETVAEGTITANTIYPREIVKLALKHNAAALVVAHNHPSGNVMPSAADRRLTRNLYLACSLMSIELLDHLIIGDTSFSFADQGLMQEIRRECHAIL